MKGATESGWDTWADMQGVFGEKGGGTEAHSYSFAPCATSLALLKHPWAADWDAILLEARFGGGGGVTG